MNLQGAAAELEVAAAELEADPTDAGDRLFSRFGKCGGEGAR
jgi:hypothetical protein